MLRYPRLLLLGPLLAFLLATASPAQQPDDGGSLPVLLNRAHPLVRTLQVWWRGVPGLAFGERLFDLMPGSQRHGTLTNMSTVGTTSGWSPATYPGGYAQVNLNGTTDYVETTQPAGLTPSTPFTLCLWARATATQLQMNLLQTCTPGDFNGVDLRFGDGDLRPELSMLVNGSATGGKIKTQSGSALALNTWYHLCATYDGSQAAAGMTLYANGTVVPTDVLTNSAFGAFTDNPWRIAAHRSVPADNFFPGALASIMIFTRAMTAREIADIYDQERRGSPDLLRPAVPPLLGLLAGGQPGGFFPFFR